MIDTGKLIIRLNYVDKRVENVTIQSTRPLHISRLFIGKTPAQTLTLLPLLFNVCSIAQAYGSFSVLTQALNIEINSTANTARQLLLSVEMIREHCWWLLINRDKTKLAPFISLVNQFKRALFIDGNAFNLNSQVKVNDAQLNALIKQLESHLNELFANQRLSLLAVNCKDELMQWLKTNDSLVALLLKELVSNNYQSLGVSGVALLPVLSDIELYNYLIQKNAAEFSNAPVWQNQAYETTCLNRCQNHPLINDLLNIYGNSVLTRLASRLIELALLPKLLRKYLVNMQHSTSFNQSLIKPNIGFAQIQASRGLLIHRVELSHEIISFYQIIAPTEWNFHFQGVAMQSLKGLVANNKDELIKKATLIINAIDPCVAFELMINEEKC